MILIVFEHAELSSVGRCDRIPPSSSAGGRPQRQSGTEDRELSSSTSEDAKLLQIVLYYSVCPFDIARDAIVSCSLLTSSPFPETPNEKE